MNALLPKNVRELHLGDGNSRPHLEKMLDPYVGSGVCSEPHPENKLTIGSGSKTTKPKEV